MKLGDSHWPCIISLSLLLADDSPRWLIEVGRRAPWVRDLQDGADVRYEIGIRSSTEVVIRNKKEMRWWWWPRGVGDRLRHGTWYF